MADAKYNNSDRTFNRRTALFALPAAAMVIPATATAVAAVQTAPAVKGGVTLRQLKELRRRCAYVAGRIGHALSNANEVEARLSTDMGASCLIAIPEARFEEALALLNGYTTARTKIEALHERAEAIRDEIDTMPIPEGADDSIFQEAFARLRVVEDEIVATPSRTMRDLAIKTSMAGEYLENNGPFMGSIYAEIQQIVENTPITA